MASLITDTPWRTLALTALALYGAAAATLYAVQRRILFVPDLAVPRMKQPLPASFRVVSVTGPGGTRLLAWFVPPSASRPVLAYFHGNGGNLADRQDRLRHYAAAGLGVLMPEYPGYGGNPGSPSEQGFAQEAAGAMDFLKGARIDGDRIALYGESIGTAVATRLASHTHVGALILESPFTSVTALAEERYPLLPIPLLLRDPFDQISRIGKINCPLLILQGAKDVVVPPDLGRAVFAGASEPKTLWVAPQGGHADLYAFGASDVVLDFIDRTFRARSTPAASRP